MSHPIAGRPLPKFDAWLIERGRTARGDEFEAFADLAKRTLLQADGAQGLNPHEASFARMWAGMAFAVVELCNMEVELHRRPAEQVAASLPRAMAAAAFYAVASTLRDDAPMRSIAKVLSEEFRFAAKQAADDYTAQLERQEKDNNPAPG